MNIINGAHFFKYIVLDDEDSIELYGLTRVSVLRWQAFEARHAGIEAD